MQNFRTRWMVLDNLDLEPTPSPTLLFSMSKEKEDFSKISDTLPLQKWESPKVAKLKPLIEAERARLAKVETEYAILKSKIDPIRFTIFKALRPLYQEQDLLRLKIEFRKSFLDALIRGGEEEKKIFEEKYREAEEAKRYEYSKTENELSSKKELRQGEQIRLAQTWKN